MTPTEYMGTVDSFNQSM